MANSEACQLFIEQQIQEGLDEGKSPYSIGKGLVDMIKQLFETNISANTLTRRAERLKAKITTNVANDTTTQNQEENQKKPEVKRTDSTRETDLCNLLRGNRHLAA
jgi:hypothetical protein